MNTEGILDKVSDIAFEHLERVAGDLLQLPEALQTVVIVYSVQGLIDNGGFRYLFENDFPGNPSYEALAAAYRRISASEAADHIEQAAAIFPVVEPHLHAAERNEFMDSIDDTHEMFRLGDRVCGDESIWKKLEAYAQASIGEFDAVVRP